MRSPRRPLTTLACGLVAALALTACGGHDDAATTSADGGLKGEPIKLMSITPTGTTGQNYPDDLAAAKASVRAINAAGGVNGRPLELEYCNQNQDASAAADCARKAVSDGVVAIVAYSAAAGSAGVHEILDPASIPIIAGQAIVAADLQDPAMFTVDGAVLSGFAACPSALKEAGATDQAVVQADVDSAAALVPLVKAGIAGSGATDSGIVLKIPTTATDFASYVRTLTDAGVTGVTTAISTPLLVQLLQGIDQAGAHIKVCSTQDAAPEDTLHGLADAASEYYATGLPPADPKSDVPGIKEFFADLKAEQDAGDDDADAKTLRASAFRGWEGPRLVQRVASTMDGEITGATLQAAFQHQNALEADMFGTIDFTVPGAVQPGIRNMSAYLSKWNVKDGGYDLLKDEPVDTLQFLGGGK
jgi:ABC-type branched-subunit amino acid transport system substrate-binding protein